MLNDHEKVWIIERYVEKLHDKLRDGAEGDWDSLLMALGDMGQRIRQVAEMGQEE